MNPVLLHSSALDLAHLRHAFSTRTGGVSPEPFASLNLSFTVGDEPSRVTHNRNAFIKAANFDGALPLGEVTQVHGINVVRATLTNLHSGELRHTKADAVWTSEPNIAVAVATADCAPVLLVALAPDGKPGAVAAIHAGWRSATSRIIHQTVRMLAEAGYQPTRMRAAIGPTIGAQMFEVGEEVLQAARFSLASHQEPRFVLGSRGRPYLDLPHLLRTHLETLGVGVIEDLGRCTMSEPEHFFSYRRDQGRTGRHLSAIQIAP